LPALTRSGLQKRRDNSIQGLKTLKAVTFTLKETGDVVGIHQLIFGGKTIRCESEDPVPTNTYYDHTDSHWQTPASYITYLQTATIAR
jgi:hypothetical protein